MHAIYSLLNAGQLLVDLGKIKIGGHVDVLVDGRVDFVHGVDRCQNDNVGQRARVQRERLVERAQTVLFGVQRSAEKPNVAGCVRCACTFYHI